MKVKILKACTWWEGGYNRRELEPGMEVEASESFGRHAVKKGLAKSLGPAGEVKEADVAAKDVTDSGAAVSGGSKAASAGRKRRG